MDVDGNLLGDVGGIILAGMMSGLTELSVAGCGLGSLGLQAICASAQNIPLKSLDLSRNKIEEDGCEAVAQVLRINGALKTLRLVSCQLGEVGIKKIFSGLASASIQELNISENRITNETATLLAAALAYGLSEFTLKSIYMSYAGLNHLAMEFLCPILKYCKNIEVVDFSSNGLGDKGLSLSLLHPPDTQKGVQTMCKIIDGGFCSNLIILRLSENQIGDDGAALITESLKYLPKLETLDLSRNHISTTSMTPSLHDSTDYCPHRYE